MLSSRIKFKTKWKKSQSLTECFELNIFKMMHLINSFVFVKEKWCRKRENYFSCFGIRVRERRKKDLASSKNVGGCHTTFRLNALYVIGLLKNRQNLKENLALYLQIFL